MFPPFNLSYKKNISHLKDFELVLRELKNNPL